MKVTVMSVKVLKATVMWERGGSLVDSTPFHRKVAGSNPALAITLGKSFTRSCLWRFGVKLRHGIRTVSGRL